jgi:hypothetical protein
MKNFQRLTLTAILAGSALLATGCASNGAPIAAGVSDTASPATVTSQEPTISASATAPAPSLPKGIIVKGVANDGTGDYLQTSIADDDPAMKYNPAITDAAAKAHYSAAELAEAQKVIVKFIAEEAIDSTLNDGTDVDGWFAAHKNQILPANQDIMLADMKTVDKCLLACESWMAKRPTTFTYVHGPDTLRVAARTISPSAFSYVESGNLQGVMLDTNVTYGMEVTDGTKRNIQNTTAEISFAVAKDAADGGKWKIAGYNTNYHTLPG